MIRRGFILALVAIASAGAVAADGPAGSKVTAQIVREKPPAAPDQGVLTLDDVVREALAKNPAISSAAHAVAAQRARVSQARAWPDPKVSGGWMGNAVPFSVQEGDPSSYRSVQAMQEIPFPGKLGLRGDIAAKQAEAARWDYEAVRRRVTAEVKSAYFEYFFFDKAIEITQRNRDLLTKLSQIAEARYRVGKGIQQDVLKAQTEASLILQRLTVLEQQRSTAQARINTLLSRPPETPLPPPAEIQPAVLAYSLDELYELAHKNDPGLHREQQMVERNQYAAGLARKEYFPDLGIGYMYQQRPLMPDMHGLTFTVNLPVFYKSKQREAVQEATEEVLSSQAAEQNRLNEVNFELKQQYLLARASQQLYELYAKGVVPQASLALESSMSAYQVGNVDFLTVLANFSNVLQYQIEYFRELANFETALTRMEPLVGMELTAARPQSPLPPDDPGNSPKK